MKCTRWLVALAMLLSVAAMAADNPYKTAKVGEWIEFAMTTQVMGQNMQMKTKQTVTARDATSVTVKTESWMGGQKLPSSEQKILLEKAFEPYIRDDKVTDAVVTPMGTGSETLTVGGKPYACKWAKVHIVATKPIPMDGITKVWSSKDVPMSGVVKMETDTTVQVGDKKHVHQDDHGAYWLRKVAPSQIDDQRKNGPHRAAPSFRAWNAIARRCCLESSVDC